MTFDHAALFGEHHREPNVYAMHGLASGTVWCALSLGGRAVLVRKAGEPVPNEDALYIAEDGSRVLLAVADGHFGHAASHDLIERLQRALEARSPAQVPRDIDELRAAVAGCAQHGTTGARASLAARRSETTLVIAVVDRAALEVWGISVGDSSAVALGSESGARWLTHVTRTYVAPSDPASLDARAVGTFRASVAPGELVVVFSDGVNECEYGSPTTSIGASHLEAVLRSAAGSPERFVERLAQLALSGVDGHPGGEDNLALAAARV